MSTNLVCFQSERAFLGAVIASRGVALDECPATAEHFRDDIALAVFGVLRDLHAERAPIDRFSMMQRLGRRVEALGGVNALSDAIQIVPASSAAHWFGVLNDKLSLRRAGELISWAGSEMHGTRDVPAFCTELQQKAARLSGMSDGDNVLISALDAVQAKLVRLRAGLGNNGIATPIKPWNTAFGGILDGQLYGLAGRPGAGKTAMMEQMIESCLDCGFPVTVFEKDMSPQKLVERMACRSAGLQFWRYARGFLHKWELDKLEAELPAWRTKPLRLYNPVSLTAERLCAIARRDIRVHGTRVVFLDHIQALRVGRDLREGLTQASLVIRACVTETNVPFVVLAHINRDGAKGGRPRPEHIKDFDQLYGDADGMVMLWTDEEKSDLTPMKFFVAKNRDGGGTEDDLLFDGPSLTFKTPA
jgi:replicative DNA helicase